MKKTVLSLLPITFLLVACPKTIPEKEFVCNDYGAFLGRSEDNIKELNKYEYVSLELDEYSDKSIKELNKTTKVFAYLNVGSLETYRDYYDDFKSITILDYENWEDERWINVSKVEWQSFIVNDIAKAMKERGAFGVYMDNVDVYSIAKEEKLSYKAYAEGIKNIIKGVSNLGLKVMVNGGAEFFDDMNNQNDTIFDYVYGYHQEEVFSVITDYDKDVFGEQNIEDKNFYQTIAKMMKAKGKEIFFLEYTKDTSVISRIKEYCEKNLYHYYVSATVDLI